MVPIDPRTGQPVPPASTPGQVAPAPVTPAPVSFSARLYPANELAGSYGIILGTVTNDRHGRGVFSASIRGEQYTGEATRKAGSPREGLASGSGSRGGYLSCQYTLNSPSLGSGYCRLHNGAEFSMHLGN